MNKLFMLPTGYGKTKTALDMLYRVANGQRIVVVVPKLVIIDSWKAEVVKWNYDKALSNIEYVTYVGLPKFIESLGENKSVGTFVFDEAHHLTDRCLECLQFCHWNHAILLSATISNEQLNLYKYVFGPLLIEKKTLHNAISDGRLPDPKIELYPLYLDDRNQSYDMMVKQNGKRVKMRFTQKGYYDKMSENIAFLKNKATSDGTAMSRNLWMQACGKRLKWLASEKMSHVSSLIHASDSERMIVFCSDIKQSEFISPYSINSKNKNSANILNRFNEGNINVITACNMLDEGCNLKDCKYGLFVYIPSSNRIQIQRIGRLLRHKEPVLRIIYFVNTREEEIVTKLLENYNPNLITRHEV